MNEICTPDRPKKKVLLQKKELVKKLYQLGRNYSSEIPDEDISGLSENINYKVRNNWWQLLVYYLEDVISLVNSEELQEEIQEFIDSVTTSEFHSRKKTREDIEKADYYIKKAIKAIKNEE